MDPVALIEEVGSFMGACGGGVIQRIPPLPNGIEQGACIGGLDATSVFVLAIVPFIFGITFLVMALSYFGMRVSSLSTTRGIEWIRKKTILIGLGTAAVLLGILSGFLLFVGLH